MTAAAVTRPHTRLAGVVLGWTVFTTTFLWTPTMRGLLRPDISSWSVMGLQGTGSEGSFWVFPALAVLALLLFYLEGRNRMRPIGHALLLGWHAGITGMVLYGTIREGPQAYFEGAMWGVRVPLLALAVPFVVFLALAAAWVAADRRHPDRHQPVPWTAIDVRALGIAALLLPVSMALFRLGEGIDWPTRLATAATVVQWILLTQALAGTRTDASSGVER